MTDGAHDIAWAAVNRCGAMQRVPELAQAYRVVRRRAEAVAPRRLILAEIGVHVGGTLWAWSQLGAEVYGITAPVPGPEFVQAHGACLVFADSHSADAAEWLRLALDGRPLDVLFIDGDHSFEGAVADWQDYGPFVAPGGLIMVHDIAYAGTDGPRRLWAVLTRKFGPACSTIVLGDDPAGFGLVEVTATMFDARREPV